MPRSKIAKSRRNDAERAAEHYLYEVCNCDPFQIRRAVKTKYQAVDFWGCDVMGRNLMGKCFYAQVTTGKTEAVRIRRRKLEKISWNENDTVLVLQMVVQPDPANNRRKAYYFRIHIYKHKIKKWDVKLTAYPIPRKWFKKLKIEIKA